MSDDEFDTVNENHSNLIESVRQLDKIQRIRKPERSEPSIVVSEFNEVKSGVTDNETANINELIKNFGRKGALAEDSKVLRSTGKKAKVLPKPLEIPIANKIKRIVGFKNTSKELGKWNGIVARNRTAEHLSFPLNQPSMRLEPSTEYLKRFRVKSDLEKALEELEPQVEEPEEKPKEFKLTAQEILERRREAAKLRAQQSYQAQKARRLRKIKSKKFHRVERKALMKKQLKEFEELQKTDPQAALEKLEELDKARAEERMSLRHKTTGQWAKNKQIRAKYDKESRQELAKQLAISRDLTQKVKKDDDSDEDEQVSTIQLQSSDKENPWITSVKTETEINDFVTSYKKYWEEKNKIEAAKKEIEGEIQKAKVKKTKKNEPQLQIHNYPKSLNPVVDVAIEHTPQSKQANKLIKKSNKKLGTAKSKLESSKKKVKATSSWTVSPVESTEIVEPKNVNIEEMFENVEESLQKKIDVQLKKVKSKYKVENVNLENDVSEDEEYDYIAKLGLKNQRLKPVFDKPLEETAKEKRVHANSEIEKLKKLAQSLDDAPEKTTVKPTEIDPKKFINMKPKELKTMLTDEATEDALDDSEPEDQQNIISEAFADDDVVDEFRKEKSDEIKNSLPENIDLSLPGWGSWGGTGIKKSSRKKRRFILKFPKDAPRRDENKGDVIIIEENDPKIRQHQVSELPHPFSSVEEFEASIQKPIGREFVPELIHKKLIEPVIDTKLGQVIDPMSDEALINLKNLKRKKKDDGSKKVEKNKKKKKVK